MIINTCRFMVQILMHMKVFFVFSLFLSSLLVFSCNQVKNAEDGSVIIRVDLENTEVISFGDIVDSVKYIQLDTSEEFLISGIKKVAYDENNIFILDAFSKLFVFSNTGEARYVIDNIGHGPEEYLSISDFSLNKTENVLEILDLNSRNVFHYSSEDGSLIAIKPLPEKSFAYTLFPIENNQYLSCLPLNVSNENHIGINLLDSSYHKIQSLIEYKGSYPVSLKDMSFISEINDGCYGLFSEIEGAVYHLNDLNLSKKYSLNVKGKNTMISLNDVDKLNLPPNTESEILEVAFYVETDKLILFIVFVDSSHAKLVFYDKNIGEAKVLDHFVDTNHPVSNFLKSNNKNMLFSSFNSEAFIDLEPKYLDAFDPALVDLIKNSNIDDNPILQILYLKH